jgi:hypothetical protein
MPLRNAQAPDQVREIATQALNQVVTQSAATVDQSKTNLTLGDPHPVYVGTLTDFAEGNGVQAATLTGWRQIIFDAAAPVAALEVSAGKESATYRFSNVNHGPFVESTIRAITNAEGFNSVKNADYEPRILKIPALYTVALWLKREEAGEDILVPIAPTPPPLTEGREYTTEEFNQALQAEARQRLAATDDAKGA